MISWFASDFFARSPMLMAPIIGLVLFLTLFAVVTARALFTNRSALDRAASLPLEDDDGRQTHE